jgi:hypothetical protein
MPVGEERSRLAEEDAELLVWFEEQYKIARERFQKYMALG